MRLNHLYARSLHSERKKEAFREKYFAAYDSCDQNPPEDRCIETGKLLPFYLHRRPADRFNVSSSKGAVAVGKLASLVILDADPATDLAAFSRVRTTIRTGQVIYSKP